MSQAVITKAFVEWKAKQAADNQPVVLDEYIFANIPGLDSSIPVSNTEGMPAADKIVHRQAVSKTGVINADSVVYSVTLGADVGDFDFNWIGLANKATGTLAMIIHAPTQRKVKNASGQQGNVLVRSMLMEYSGAQTATNITTPAETWQIDFTARLAGMDERHRKENMDLYGAAAFFDTGYLVAKTGAQFFVTKGAGYVAGLRSELVANQNITVTTKPTKVWLDVCWKGTLTSVWAIESKLTVAASLANYIDSGVQHYVFALASIDASGNVTDLRPKGTLDNQQGNKDFMRKDANLSDVSDPAKARESLKLGDAALSTVTKSDTDTTGGRLVKVGDYGLSFAIKIAANTDLVAFLKTASGAFYHCDGSTNYINAPPSFGSEWFDITMTIHEVNDYRTLLAVSSGGRMAAGSIGAGKFSGWRKVYTDFEEPGSYLPLKGGTLTGGLSINKNAEGLSLRTLNEGQSSYILSRDYDNSNSWYVGRGGASHDASLYNYKGKNGIALVADGSISLNASSGKHVYAALMTVNDRIQLGNSVGSGTLMIGDNDSGLKNSVDGQIDLWANNQKVGHWSGTQLYYYKQIVPGDYGNFDARYFTQSAANTRFVTGVRLGASSTYQERGLNERMTGGVMTSWQDSGSSNYWIRLRPLQYWLNGSWVTAAYA